MTAESSVGDADHERESALARAAATGDRQAAELLLGLVHPQVFAICRRICGPAGDAEDAAQDALISIARALPSFDGRSAVRTWVYRIATNAALDELRRRRRRARPVDPLLDLSPIHSPPGTPRRPGRSAQGDPVVGSHEAAVVDRIDIDAALAQLPAEFRAAVILRDLIGMEYADIAATLDLPIGTVRSRIARGRGRLRELLGVGNQPGSTDVERSDHD